jgi:hypothetical protein
MFELAAARPSRRTSMTSEVSVGEHSLNTEYETVSNIAVVGVPTASNESTNGGSHYVDSLYVKTPGECF